MRMAKFHAHAATYKANLEHGTTPGRAVNPYQYGTGAVKGMAGHQRHISIQNEQLVAGVAGGDLEPGPWLHILQAHAALNLRLNNVAVYLVAEVGMWPEQAGIVQQKSLCSLDARRKGWLQFDSRQWRICPNQSEYIRCNKAERDDTLLSLKAPAERVWRTGSGQEDTCKAASHDARFLPE
jgi:hypothetical protein